MDHRLDLAVNTATIQRRLIAVHRTHQIPYKPRPLNIVNAEDVCDQKEYVFVENL